MASDSVLKTVWFHYGWFDSQIRATDAFTAASATVFASKALFVSLEIPLVCHDGFLAIVCSTRLLSVIWLGYLSWISSCAWRSFQFERTRHLQSSKSSRKLEILSSSILDEDVTITTFNKRLWAFAYSSSRLHCSFKRSKVVDVAIFLLLCFRFRTSMITPK